MPTNNKTSELEGLLRRATYEPGWRPLFYRRLLDATVLVPAVLPASQRGDLLRAGSVIHIVRLHRNDGAWVIPFFTSALTARRGVPTTPQCVAMLGRELFASSSGMPLHLNPNCEYGREFTPEEAEALLEAGSMLSPACETLDRDTAVHIEPLATLPPFTVSLRILYATHANVRTAYLARARFVDRGDTAGLLVGIEASNPNDGTVFRDTATVLQDCNPGTVVDAISINPSDGAMGQRIAERIAPFYVRSNQTH